MGRSQRLRPPLQGPHRRDGEGRGARAAGRPRPRAGRTDGTGWRPARPPGTHGRATARHVPLPARTSARTAPAPTRVPLLSRPRGTAPSTCHAHAQPLVTPAWRAVPPPAPRLLRGWRCCHRRSARGVRGVTAARRALPLALTGGAAPLPRPPPAQHGTAQHGPPRPSSARPSGSPAAPNEPWRARRPRSPASQRRAGIVAAGGSGRRPSRSGARRRPALQSRRRCQAGPARTRRRCWGRRGWRWAAASRRR